MPRTRRLILCVTFSLMAVLSTAQSPQLTTAAFICDPPDLVIDEEEIQLLNLLNQYRLEYGLPMLELSENLNRSASWLAADLASGNYLDHTDRYGRTFYQRLADCGAANWAVGEVLARGTVAASSRAAFEMWGRSPSHNGSLLDPLFKYVGISRAYGSSYGWYWVADFSSDW